MEIINACFPLFGMFIILSTPITLYVIASTAYQLRKMPPLDEKITLTLSLFVSVYCASSAYQWAMHNLREAKQSSHGSTYCA